MERSRKRKAIEAMEEFAESLVHQATLLQWMVQKLKAEINEEVIIEIVEDRNPLPARRKQLIRPLKLIGNGDYTGNNAIR
jgi:hypothetical protein